jgi:hypothetical protein
MSACLWPAVLCATAKGAPQSDSAEQVTKANCIRKLYDIRHPRKKGFLDNEFS